MKTERYSYDDVIINPNDFRLPNAKGAKCYFGDSPYTLLSCANKSMGASSIPSVVYGELLKVETFGDKPFCSKYLKHTCLIIDYYQKTFYEPYDLEKEEDRDQLKFAWVKDNEGEQELSITGFEKHDGKWTWCGIDGKFLFENYKFTNGMPVGKLKEENREIV